MIRKTLSVMTTVAAGLSMGLVAITATAQERTAGNEYWWPDRLSLEPLRVTDSASNPLGEDFDYAEAFERLDLEAVKVDLIELMTTSQDWWPADYGNYGPFFIRMAWHSAGTYRAIDGRGGADGAGQRFAPLNSWPDNANLDKARYLLEPIKEKYGRAISWADLIVLAGTVAMDSMGFETLGFAGGRDDAWEPEDVDWGPEGEWLSASRRDEMGKLEGAFGATQMGLIYVNPEGPDGVPDPQAAADSVREAFGRMAMNDEETVALIAGGHTFGKAHGAAPASEFVGAEPEAAPLEAMGLGWRNSYGTGNGSDTITSGLEGAWTQSPAEWTHSYLTNLYTYEWEQTRGPGGAAQWQPVRGAASTLVPDAHDPLVRHAPMMFTTDIALKVDPIYREITMRWLDNPAEFEDAFARAWFKLTHRDMGPSSRYLGADVPDQEFIWQDPIPDVDYELINSRDAARLKRDILDSGLSNADLVRTAWASASTYRGTDMRGGANGARIRLAPQNGWAANDPVELKRVLGVLAAIREEFNGSEHGNKRVSMADLIVLGGSAAIERAASLAGFDLPVPFLPGRNDATQDQTDVDSFAMLEPTADGFRNYFASENNRSPTDMLVEKAALLELTVPEMTVLVGGMRALGANAGGVRHGVFTDRPGTLSNDFFRNLLDLSTIWERSTSEQGVYVGRNRSSGVVKWTATPADLIFGSNSELRAVAAFYAADDAAEEFVYDFVDAWSKVMALDRFDQDRTERVFLTLATR
jgi:catalase-peroxidase